MSPRVSFISQDPLSALFRFTGNAARNSRLQTTYRNSVPCQEPTSELFTTFCTRILREARRRFIVTRLRQLIWKYDVLVCEYTGRSLTYDSDKLSALAQRLHPFIDEKYLAGVWSNDLKHGLFWSRSLAIYDSRLTHIAPYRRRPGLGRL